MRPNISTCVIEMTPPKIDAPDKEKRMQTFAERFQRIMESGFVSTISDNVMGNPHVQCYEIIEQMKLKPKSDQVIVHINTFHEKEELDRILSYCKSKDITNFLILTGDGSEMLHKLEPWELDEDTEEVTSVELLRYVKREYPEFTCGVAYDPYVDQKKEMDKLQRKVEAGADFVITQPILGKNELLEQVMEMYPDVPVIIEAWMTKNVKILGDIVGYEVKDFDTNRYAKLLELMEIYPDNPYYMSMISFANDYQKVEELYKTRIARKDR